MMDLKGSFTLCRENAGVISCLFPIDALDQKKPDGGDGDDYVDGDDDGDTSRQSWGRQYKVLPVCKCWARIC